MPRQSLSPRKARAALLALRVESARRAARESRKDYQALAAALALRQNTPDWVDMDARIKQLQFEAEMDAMESYLDERCVKTPVLNFDLMPGFSPPDDVRSKPTETGTAPENSATSANDKNWDYPGHGDNPRPEDDWRNYG